jgi:phage shock protein A
MGLLERAARLIRANLNDLIDRAEDPEKLLKQVILDMQNQMMQVKTQVAIAVADRHLLEKKRKQALDAEADLLRKAELGMAKGKEQPARAAVEQAISQRQIAAGLAEQLTDQTEQVERLKEALDALGRKLAEAKAKSELLLVRHRRARAVSRAAQANGAISGDFAHDNVFARMQEKTVRAEATGEALNELAAPSADEELAALAREDEVEVILRDLRKRHS